jgi:MFS transporter, FHS family, Na+ dependent glucose transporter 1
MSTNRIPANAIIPTTVFYLAFILLGLTTAATGPTLPVLASHTSSRIDQISFIFITGSLGYLIGSWIGGRLYDRFPGNRVLPIGLLVLAASAALIPSASQLVILALAILLLGFSQGVIDVGGNTLLMWIHGNGVGPYMNGLHFFFGVGTLLLPILVAQILNFSGEIIWVYRLFSLLALPLAIWSWFIRSPVRQNKVSSEPKRKVNFVMVLFIALLFFLYVGAELSYGNWIFTYTISLQLGTPTSAAYLTAAFWGFFTLGRLAGIPISTRLDSLKILFGDLLGSLGGLGIIIAGSNSTTALWLGTILLGLCMASFFATLMSLAESKLHISGEITGLFLVGSGLGGMILPWVIGQTFSSIGPLIMPVLIFIDLLTGLILLAVLANRFAGLNKSEVSITPEKTAP